MMSSISLELSDLFIMFTVVAAVLTGVIGGVFKKHNNWLTSFIQNFLGVWYIFSGYVKAVDPLGTAYKMEQYFTAFESTFEPTWMGFIAPIFPFMSSIAIYFSVFMIILEVLLGIALIIGWRPKFTGRVFLLLLLFFTALTGFTFLTGYVGSGVNFFEFSKWGAFKESNMQVQDCGCFGDFLKLLPKTSFFKDLFLLIPAIIVLLMHKSWHQLFSPKIRSSIMVGSTLLLLLLCMSNYVWDIPNQDLRPFKQNVNVKTERTAQLNAMGSVQILKWKLKNKESGKVVELPNAQYMKEFKSYPKAEWEVFDQVKSEPAVPANKISEMEFSSFDGEDYTEKILEDPEASFLIIAHKMYAKGFKDKRIVRDSIFKVDTLQTVERDGVEMIANIFDRVEEKEVSFTNYKWDEAYLTDWKETIKPLADKAAAKGVKVYVISGGMSKDVLESLVRETGIKATFLTADDILLKTMVRSNPGIMLWKDGSIVNKWHKSKFPGFDNCGI